MDTLKFITKKYGLNLTARSPLELPKVSRADLAKLFAELGFTKGAEVGTWSGAYTTQLCGANTSLKLIGVDLNSKTPRKIVPNNCKLVKMNSLDAAKRFVDASLDFVYLDTDGDFPTQTSDIHAWSKKVRQGGLIAGHDYFRYRSTCTIRCWEAVHAYTQAYRISPWFVIGRNTDRIRSWFWVKA